MWDNLPAFIATSFLIESTPGPNMAFLALVGAREGRRYGFATTAGVALGLLIIGLLAASGVATLISVNPLLFQILRWGGIAYLLYLAWEGWRDGGESSPHRTSNTDDDLTYFRHGLIVNLLNPKAALFYVTILPTFLSSSESGNVEYYGLTVLYVAIATIMHILIVTFASFFHPFLSDPKKSRIVSRALSAALALVAIWFGWSTRTA